MTASRIDIGNIYDAMRDAEKICRDMLHGLSKLANMPCQSCGRRPIVTKGPFGDTLQVCHHLWNAIERYVPKAEPPTRIHSGLPPIGWSPYGIHIELFDDGPQRWQSSTQNKADVYSPSRNETLREKNYG